MSGKEVNDLLDKVEGTFGWRVEKIGGRRWKVTPPQPHDIIHVVESGDPHAVHNFKAQLRRAGFFHKTDPNMNKSHLPPTLPPPPIVANAVVPTPIEAIRADMEVIFQAIARINDNVDKMEQEQEGVTQLKQLLRTVIK